MDDQNLGEAEVFAVFFFQEMPMDATSGLSWFHLFARPA
jgi:hypothetical protein